MLVYWHHYSHAGKRIEVETEDDSIGGHFLRLLQTGSVKSYAAGTLFGAVAILAYYLWR